jgi:hypothetical protein
MTKFTRKERLEARKLERRIRKRLERQALVERALERVDKQTRGAIHVMMDEFSDTLYLDFETHPYPGTKHNG